MKDITRIHIAKVAYDIELPAKKILEAYMIKLESYSEDIDVLDDIEIRITELLLERHVAENGVIAMADVEAIKTQLGDPKEFTLNEEAAFEHQDELTHKRRLYRDGDRAIVGGVLAGIANYIKIDPLWVRLAFILLTLVSLGLALLGYGLLWLLIPLAKTATEKLQMSGEAVTLSSLRDFNQREKVDNSTPAVIRRLITITIGLAAVFMAVGLIFGSLFTFGIFSPQQIAEVGLGEVLREQFGASYVLTVGLGVAAAALLVVLMLLIAYAAFKESFSKRIWVTGIAIIALGLCLFGASVVSVMYGSSNQRAEITRSVTTREVQLPDELKSITSFTASDLPRGVHVNYVVSTKIYAEISAPLGDKVSVVVDKNHASLQYSQTKSGAYYGSANGVPVVAINIHGPALATIKAMSSSFNYDNARQSSLVVSAENGSSVIVSESRIKELTVSADDSSSFDGESSNIENISLDIRGAASARVGTVQSLKVVTPSTCATGAISTIYAQSVNDNATHNGAKLAKGVQYEDSCTSIDVASDNQ